MSAFDGRYNVGPEIEILLVTLLRHLSELVGYLMK